MGDYNRDDAASQSFGWEHDLPGPHDAPVTRPLASMLSPPNHIDETYMELPRATLQVRGVGFWLIICVAPPIICLFLVSLGRRGMVPLGFMDLCLVAALVGGIYIFGYIWRMDMEAPVDEPIRFNRLRRKIYVYHFGYCGINLFSRTKWGVFPKTYDWDNVRAEYCSAYGPMGTGGVAKFVNLLVVEPGTGKVLDRLFLAHGRLKGEMYWAMAQLYMQQGPEAIPKFDRPPRDWNNEVHFENIARRFAPKVKWPDAMDLESRTAP